MSRLNPYRTLWLTVWIWSLLGQSFLGAEGNTDLHEKIEYHLRELRKGMFQLQGSHIHKRSANLDHDEIIYSSLVAFCSQMTGQNNPKSDTITTTSQQTNGTSLGSLTKSGAKPKKITWTSKWPLPDPLLVKVQAERVAKKVWLVFDVVHSTHAYIARVHSFDYKKKDVDYLGKLSTPVLSRVGFELDSTACGEGTENTDLEAEFWISKTGGQYSEQVFVDVCMFDKVYNESTYQWDKREDKILSENIPRPMLKALTKETDKIVIEKGRNVSFEMDVHLFKERETYIHVKLWDRTMDTVLQSRAALSLGGIDVRGISVKSGPRDLNDDNLVDKLITVEVVNETIFNFTASESDDYGEWKNVSAKVKVTVNTANGTRSGIVVLDYLLREPDYYKRPIVRMLRAGQEIRLVLPKKPEVLPKNYVEIFNRGKSQCDKDGIRGYRRLGRNCTVACHAYGKDIRSLIIKRSKSKTIKPVQSVSYVMDDRSAFAMWDVGPASRSIEGKYKCVVETYNGKKTKKEMSLYTSKFTKVENLTVTEFNNGSSRVICTATGLQPLNISISTLDDDGKEHDLTFGGPVWQFTTGDELKLIRILRTSLLKYPSKDLLCRASGERGVDGQMLPLSSYIRHQNPHAAKINRMPNATYVYDYQNGTASITCAATGRNLTIWVTRGGSRSSIDSRIDDKPENVRMVTETAEGKTLKLLVPRKSLTTSPRYVDCYAKNKHADDWFTMYLYEFRS